MATTLACSLANPIRASFGSNEKPDPSRRKPVSSSSSSWWTPLFGWSSSPDYLNDSNNAGHTSEKKPDVYDPKSDPGRSKPKYALGCFTQEKAKQLRRKEMENVSFHDMMYHSAIASRMASDISVWSEK